MHDSNDNILDIAVISIKDSVRCYHCIRDITLYFRNIPLLLVHDDNDER